MNIHDIAEHRRWTLPNSSPAGGEITIAGWDFGGRGELALLHHANGMCAATWALVAAGLTEHFRVVAIDARGHGDSQHLSVPDDYAWHFFANDLVALVDALRAETGAGRVALGLGSLTATARAQRQPVMR